MQSFHFAADLPGVMVCKEEKVFMGVCVMHIFWKFPVMHMYTIIRPWYLFQLPNRFEICTEHGSDTAMLCAKFQNDWETKK